MISNIYSKKYSNIDYVYLRSIYTHTYNLTKSWYNVNWPKLNKCWMFVEMIMNPELMFWFCNFPNIFLQVIAITKQK